MQADFKSTWQRHKNKKCKEDCWYCKDENEKGESFQETLKNLEYLETQEKETK